MRKTPGEPGATTGDFFGWTDRRRTRAGDDDAGKRRYRFLPRCRAAVVDWAYANLTPQWAEGFSVVGPVAPYATRSPMWSAPGTTHHRPGTPPRISESRFGITPIVLPGSHSPFLSHPALLAWTFDRIVAADQAGSHYAPA